MPIQNNPSDTGNKPDPNKPDQNKPGQTPNKPPTKA